jgi:hypothetical protein
VLHADDTSPGVDFGAMASFGRARFGLTVRDLTEPAFGSGDGGFTLERHARAGAALTSGSRGVIGSATVSLDADLTTTHDPAFGDERVVALGAEAWTPKRNIGVRGGLSKNTVGTSATSLAGGLSIAVKSGTYVDGYMSGGDSNTRHGWGLALRVTF